jgi:hypothetical protein
VRGLFRGMDAHEVATLGARTTFPAATSLVLAPTGRAFVTGCFRGRGLDRRVEGTIRVARRAALAASTTTAATASIAAALTLTLSPLTLSPLTLALTLTGRGLTVW